jgi:hypothetical protein
VSTRVGRGAASPLRFVFVRRLAAQVPAPRIVSIRKPRASARRSGRDVAAPVPLSTGSLSANLEARQEVVAARPPSAPPWVPPLLSETLAPAEMPAGLPPIPAMLLEGDVPSGASGRRDDPHVGDEAVHDASAGAVWLTGCDPRTLLLGWEDPASGPGATPGPTEWRLRPESNPDAVLAGGPLPVDRRFLFLEAPAPGTSQVAEIGTRGPGGAWECLATSAPVALPDAAPDLREPALDLAWHSTEPAGVRPGFTRSYFAAILDPGSDPQGSTASSDFGLRLPGDVAGNASSGGLAAWGNQGGGRSSSGAMPPAGREALDAFRFRVHAEVVIHGSTEPDARVTLSGRVLPIRPDGSFSIRFSLPDGRFDLPLVAVSSRGAGFRSAALTLERSTRVQGEVGVHPIDPDLQPPGVPSGAVPR